MFLYLFGIGAFFLWAAVIAAVVLVLFAVRPTRRSLVNLFRAAVAAWTYLVDETGFIPAVIGHPLVVLTAVIGGLSLACRGVVLAGIATYPHFFVAMVLVLAFAAGITARPVMLRRRLFLRLIRTLDLFNHEVEYREQHRQLREERKSIQAEKLRKALRYIKKLEDAADAAVDAADVADRAAGDPVARADAALDRLAADVEAAKPFPAMRFVDDSDE